jgi:3-oxoacyl-[acyl-carrier-protein] synthase III
VDYNPNGIKERRILDEDKGTSHLAIKAAQDLLNQMLIH